MTTVDEIVSILKKNVEEKKFVDISSGVEKLFDVSRTTFLSALSNLVAEGGYRIHKRIKTQIGTGKQVKLKILTKDTGVTYRDVYEADVKPVEKD
jgi:hypothetical protein